jgi:DNA-binding MarR family transcriptional regulator
MIRFTKVRNDFIEADGLTPTEKLVAIYLYGRMRRDRRPWQVDYDQIASALHITPYAAKKAVAVLRRKGLVSDNRKAVRTASGQIRRERATVVESRRSVVVAPDATFAQVAPKVEIPTSVNLPSNELLSDERLYAGSEPANGQATREDPWSVPATQEATSGLDSSATPHESPPANSSADAKSSRPMENSITDDLGYSAGETFDADEWKERMGEVRRSRGTSQPSSRRFRETA